MRVKYIEREVTCKDCFHYCVCKDTVADENWEEDAPKEVREMFSPSGCKNYKSTTDVVEVRHGKWLITDTFDHHKIPIYRCSICNKEVADHYINLHKHCLHCGTEMNTED